MNPVDRLKSVTIEQVLIDTGATRTTLPRGIAQELGLEILGSQTVRSAGGPVTIDQSYAMLRIEGRQSINDVWISDSYPNILIGVVTLEAMGFGVDPKNQRLIDVEQLLL